MKLSDLCPEPIRFISKDRYRILPLDTPPSKADGIMFLCPVCFQKNGGPAGTHSMLPLSCPTTTRCHDRPFPLG